MNTQQNGRKSIASQHIAISMTSPSKRRRIFSEPESCDDSRAFLPNTVKSANEKPRGYEIPAVHFSGASRKNPSEEEEYNNISYLEASNTNRGTFLSSTYSCTICADGWV